MVEMNEEQLREKISSRLKELPKVVRDAILSADVEAHMRELAEHHKLHFDQWTALENEVMFTLLGFEPVENLAANIEKEVGVSREIAGALAEDISRIVFVPIRAALEQGLKTSEQSTEKREQSVRNNPPAPSAPPGTPPAPSPEGKAIRAPISESYEAGQASHERRMVEGDPYREQPT